MNESGEEAIQAGDCRVQVIRKDIKNIHFSVKPPDGKAILSIPLATRYEAARAFALSKLPWIREKQASFQKQTRETLREYIERESHYLWGKRYLLHVVERDGRPSVSLGHREIILIVRPGSAEAKRAEVLGAWRRRLLHQEIPPLLEKWSEKLGVPRPRYFLRRMKTRWGSCNRLTGYIMLNARLAGKPRNLLEYVIMHELAHFLEPRHNNAFVAILDRHYSGWRDARAELNELPLAAEAWRE
ncbi:MAG: M48 family metallopeptidase [Planctomycetota bacterium]|jgi:predicted metal-dependent hydrolase|nr:M48 family metallopeptidase [Planctomycetota bacterium]